MEEKPISASSVEITELDAAQDAKESLELAFENFYRDAAESYVKGFNKALPEQFHIICDEKTGDKSFRNSDNRPLLTAKTWEDLSWGLMAFYIGYNYRHNEVKENAQNKRDYDAQRKERMLSSYQQN